MHMLVHVINLLAVSKGIFIKIISTNSEYHIEQEITREFAVEFSPVTEIKFEILLPKLKVLINNISLNKFSDHDLRAVKILKKNNQKIEEFLLEAPISVQTHLQAIKQTVSPFRDVGVYNKQKSAGEEGSKVMEKVFGGNHKSNSKFNLQCDYFNSDKKEENQNESVDDFYKKVEDIQQKIKLDDQYIPTLDGIEDAFYDFIEMEAEIKREFEKEEKMEVKLE